MRYKVNWLTHAPFQPRLIIRRGNDWWRVYRFGIEKNPLFSERNQTNARYGQGRWHYYFGGRLSIWRR